VRTGAISLGITFGVVTASAALTYVDTWPTEASRRVLVEGLRGDSGFSVLFGQVDGIDTVGGYTAYKGYVFLTTIGAVWAALVVCRLLRGEEENGRWQMVLAGRTNPARATLATLAGVGCAIGVVFAGTTALTVLAGAQPDVGFGLTDSLTFGLSIVVAPLCFAGVAAVCSQLAQTRRLATSLAIGVFAVCFVVRMIADSSASSHWMLWLTPLGWVELMKPFTSNRLLPLAPAAALVATTCVTAVWLAARRDAGSGALAASESASARPFGLGSPLGLATRLNAPVLAGWAAGIASISFVMGIVAKAAASAVAESDSAASMLDKLGAHGGGAKQYLGVVFLLTGATLALVPASQVGSARDEEASGRLVHILARPPSRRAWLAGRVGLAVAGLVSIGALAGAATWAGARSQGLTVSFADTMLAGLNIIPAALLALALGMLTLAFAPRRAPAVVYVVVGGSLIVDLVGSLVTSLGSLTRVSIFHYVALAPAEDPSWANVLASTAIAALLIAVAIAAFDRRDLAAD
jgi:ABC-2 type transport system permease protein